MASDFNKSVQSSNEGEALPKERRLVWERPALRRLAASSAENTHNSAHFDGHANMS
jgi:hypothetical protein